jgi:hypothetical protein
MLKKSLTGVLAAGAMAVPLAAAAWADPAPNPNPPAPPGANAQGPVNPAMPAVPSSNGQGPVCVVGANPPAPGTFQGVTAQGTSVQVPPGTTWQQVTTLQGPVASDLGLPAGQPANVFCASTGSPNPLGQPAGYQPGQTNPGQAPLQNPAPGQQNLGQTNPAEAPLQNPPGQTGPQNPAPGEQNPAPGQQNPAPGPQNPAPGPQNPAPGQQ